MASVSNFQLLLVCKSLKLSSYSLRTENMSKMPILDLNKRLLLKFCLIFKGPVAQWLEICARKPKDSDLSPAANYVQR